LSKLGLFSNGPVSKVFALSAIYGFWGFPISYACAWLLLLPALHILKRQNKYSFLNATFVGAALGVVAGAVVWMLLAHSYAASQLIGTLLLGAVPGAIFGSVTAAFIYLIDAK